MQYKSPFKTLNLFIVLLCLVFSYCRSSSTPTQDVLATASSVSLAPQQVHLHLTDDPHSRIVSWISFQPLSPSYLHLNNKAKYVASNQTYNVGGWNGTVYFVNLPNLAAQQTYTYTVTTGILTSDSYEFMMPLNADRPFRFVVYGDQGWTPFATNVVDDISTRFQTADLDLVLVSGDLAYPDLFLPGPNETLDKSRPILQELWDYWGNLIVPLNKWPNVFSIGNHETYFDRQSYKTRFFHPQNNQFWYNYDWVLPDGSKALIVSMSTEDDYMRGSLQWNYLKKTLCTTDPIYTWKILVMHRSIYSSLVDDWAQHSPGAPRQVALEPIMAECNVDIGISSHYHSYERMFPTINGTEIVKPVYNNTFINPKIPIHVLIATGGMEQDPLFVNPQPEWSAMRTTAYGYGIFEIFNSTHLYYQFQHVEAAKTVLDSFWILKE